MRIAIVGGGPGGLYLAVLLKRRDPTHEVVLYERNRADDTFGFGVVFSDATLGGLAEADPESFAAITADFAHWDDIDVHFGGRRLRSSGHGFAGLSRQRLLTILQARCVELGVTLHFEHPIDDATTLDADLIVAADGLNSATRAHWAEHFKPHVIEQNNRFAWFGTTRQFPAFTFYFKRNEHGLFRIHAYNYEAGHSTFIVETTDAAWRASGLDTMDEQASADYCAALFADELAGHPLLLNRSIWRRFPTVSCTNWYHKNVALLGDAVHTAHFSIGSGTKLAMEDAIALAKAIESQPDLAQALDTYETDRIPVTASTQRAAAVSLAWFEETERAFDQLEPEQFTFSLLTRSLRITHENLRLRDPEFVAQIDRWVMDQAAEQVGIKITGPTPPPMFTPFRLRDMVLSNRVVLSPMCQYSAEDGTPDDWHLVHLGSRAIGGAGLIITEMTDVSRMGRITPGCTGLYKASHVEAWKRITDFVHTQSDARIAVQLAHAGRKGSTRLAWEGIDQPLSEGNWPLLAASPIRYLSHSQIPKPMDRADMFAITADFVRAAQMAEQAGFDMLELHCAHGYLLHTFLSPITNHRTDEYGGSPGNRMRYPLEVFAAVRAVWPTHKPMSVRISATDWIEGGFDESDAVAFSLALRGLGCDIIDVSTGQTDPASKPQYGRLYQTPFAERVRLESGIPTMTVGNISSYADVNSVIAAGRADLCALARAHLFDPYWTRHAAFEQGWDLAWPKQYAAIQQYRPRFEWSPRGQLDPNIM